MSDDTDETTVYLAIDPGMTDPVFATTDFDVASEFAGKSPNNFYKELGLVDAEEAREIMNEMY